MTVGLILGLLAGLATAGLSEIVLRIWGPNPMKNIWRLLLVGMGLRTVWVLGVLAVVLTARTGYRAPFTAALLAGYLAAQIWEGFRYRRFIETQ